MAFRDRLKKKEGKSAERALPSPGRKKVEVSDGGPSDDGADPGTSFEEKPLVDRSVPRGEATPPTQMDVPLGPSGRSKGKVNSLVLLSQAYYVLKKVSEYGMFASERNKKNPESRNINALLARIEELLFG